MLRHIMRIYNVNVIVNGNANLHLRKYLTTSTEIKPLFVNYLMESLGFSEKQSLTTHSKLVKGWPTVGEKRVTDFKFVENADSVIGLFKKHGFSDTQIRNVVSINPLVLTAQVDKTLIPKFRALQDHGFSGSDIADIFSVNAGLLRRSMDSTALPAIRIVGQVLGLSGDDVVSFLKKSYANLMRSRVKNLETNVAFLGSYGVPLDLIRMRLIMAPSPFFARPETFEEVVIKVEHKLGIPPHSKMFLLGVQLLVCCNGTIDSKIEAFKSFGWTESDVMGLCRHNPLCLSFSVLSIKKKLGFLMKVLGYTPGYLVMRPALLTYSLEKRIVPRHTILEVLRLKGLIREDYLLYTALCLTELFFLKQFVLPFKEVHELYSELTGRPLRLPTEELEKTTCEG